MFWAQQQKGSKEKENLNQTVIDSSTDRLISELIFRKKNKRGEGGKSQAGRDLIKRLNQQQKDLAGSL